MYIVSTQFFFFLLKEKSINCVFLKASTSDCFVAFCKQKTLEKMVIRMRLPPTLFLYFVPRYFFSPTAVKSINSRRVQLFRLFSPSLSSYIVLNFFCLFHCLISSYVRRIFDFFLPLKELFLRKVNMNLYKEYFQ